MLSPAKDQTPPRKVYIYNKADFSSMKAKLRRIKETFISLEPVSTTQELWYKFSSSVSDLMTRYIPTKMLSGKKIKKLWINRKLKAQMPRRNKLFRRMKKTKNKTDIRKFKECKKAVQKIERESYWTYINNIIHDHNPKKKRFWNYIKSLGKDSTGIAPLKDNGRLFNASKDKADILNRQYQSRFTQEDLDTQVPDPDGKPYPDMNNIYVSEDGVRKLLQKINLRKATGPDMIPARLLKECSEELARILAIIYNKSIQTGKVLDDWKKANVSAVFKKGQHYDPANYRPVSLICLCCKILEHITVSSVMKHVDTQSILTDCQHGFRARRSCESQLVTLTHDLASSLDDEKQTDNGGPGFLKGIPPCPPPAYNEEAAPLWYQRLHISLDIIILIWSDTEGDRPRVFV